MPCTSVSSSVIELQRLLGHVKALATVVEEKLHLAHHVLGTIHSVMLLRWHPS